MKKVIVFCITVLFVFGIVSTAMAKKKQGKQLYTAYNIWVLKDTNMRLINYKAGKRIIPAGTPIRKLRKVYVSNSPGQERTQLSGATSGDYYAKIRFWAEGYKWKIRIGIEKRYHPGKTLDDYMKLMFTEKTFEEQTAGMTDREIAAIQNGVLIEGMSKKAVIMSYGYPPEHRTPSLDNNDWTYWMNKRESKKICFGEDERTMRCEKRKEVIKLEDTL